MAIEVGTKLIIHHTRGGIVVLPVVGSAAAGTGLSSVDVPTNLVALVDPTDSNYWYLSWRPGSNNANVSVNIQTGSYPANHGVVVGSGSTTKLFSKSITSTRIRFSGPSTVYYVKLWGELNGIYSATGATITITSGAGVVPFTDPVIPEVIGVFDQYLCAGAPVWGSAEDIVIYSANLPFVYTGTGNVYIGGPVVDTSFDAVPDGNGAFEGPQTVPRYMYVANWMILTGPKGSISIGNNVHSDWYAPVNISNLLTPGQNVVTITIHSTNTPFKTASSDLHIRSYYL